jgi:DNA processing protein
VPGPITSATSTGCNKLIQQGAKPALTVADILEELGLVAAAGAVTEARVTAPAWPPDLTGPQRSLCESLAAAPSHVDALTHATGLDSGAVLAVLTELELRGLVVQRPGMIFQLQGAE